MNVNLHIERLILDGIPLGAGQQPLLQGAIEAEITRLVDNGGLSSGLMRGGAIAAILGGTIQLSGESNPTNLGQGIARAVYGGLSNES